MYIICPSSTLCTVILPVSDPLAMVLNAPATNFTSVNLMFPNTPKFSPKLNAIYLSYTSLDGAEPLDDNK